MLLITEYEKMDNLDLLLAKAKIAKNIEKITQDIQETIISLERKDLLNEISTNLYQNSKSTFEADLDEQFRYCFG